MGKRIIFKLFYFFSVSMTLFIVVITIAAALARNFDPESYNWMPYYGLLLPFLLVLNIILVLY
ncbi:MAG: hypothetical protein LUE93_10675 [Bacteroides sp.]|nr:hypothetical protein [Bacteroides sp.]